MTIDFVSERKRDSMPNERKCSKTGEKHRKEKKITEKNNEGRGTDAKKS